MKRVFAEYVAFAASRLSMTDKFTGLIVLGFGAD
jgi:hypothetical protein